MNRAVALLLFLSAAVLAQKSLPRSVSGNSYNTILSTVADGGYWKTTFIVMNIDKEQAASYTIRFFGNDGKPLTLPIVGRGRTTLVAGALNKGQSVFIETEGTAPNLVDGWAQFEGGSGAEVSAMAIYGTVNVPNRPDFEAVVPLEYRLDTDLRLPFDNTNGAITSAALVNPSTYQDTPVELVAYDETGAVLATEKITLKPGVRQAFAIPERMQATRGRRGQLRAFADGFYSLSLMGLRFNKAGGFTSIHCLSVD